MANLTEQQQWEAGIYQLEETDVVQGGPNGIDNLQAKQLANRTAYLKGLVDALGTGKQPIAPLLTALAQLDVHANQMIYGNGPGTIGLATLSAFARTLIDDADAAAMRATLGLGNSATRDVGTAAGQVADGAHGHGSAYQAADPTLAALAALTTAANQIIYATGADSFALATLSAFARTLIDDADAAAMRATLGLGNSATRDVGNAVGQVAAGDHGHADYYNAIQALNASIAAKQNADPTLAALAALGTAANQIIYATGADSFALATLSAFARTLIDDADAAAMRATLGLGDMATQNLWGTFTFSGLASGYYKMPFGMTLQWGSALVPADSQVTISLPTSFPVAPFGAMVTIESPLISGAEGSESYNNLTQNQITLCNGTNSQRTLRFLAIGG